MLNALPSHRSNYRIEVQNLPVSQEMKDELEAEYFLIKRGTVIGGIIGVFLVTGLVSWGAAKATIESSAEGQMIKDIKQGSEIAKSLIDGDRLLPRGSLLLTDIRVDCPDDYLRIADVGLKTLEDDNGLYRRSLSATRDSTYSEDVNANWDRRIYKVCSFSP